MNTITRKTGSRTFNSRQVVHAIYNKGATCETVEKMTGYDRTSIQRFLKGVPVPGSNRLTGGHYTTVEGYNRLLAKVRENTRAARQPTATKTPAPVTPAPVTPAPVTSSPNCIAIVETGFLYYWLYTKHRFDELLEQYETLYIPERCIRELETAKKNTDNATLKEFSATLLSDIVNTEANVEVLSECTDLFVEPYGFNKPIKPRSISVISTLCKLFSDHDGTAPIKLLTSSREISRLASQQQFPISVKTCYVPAIIF